jgi:hypothetical protein
MLNTIENDRSWIEKFWVQAPLVFLEKNKRNYFCKFIKSTNVFLTLNWSTILSI